MTNFRRGTDDGFSLLETIIALAMFAIILAATGWAVITALHAQAQAEARDKAVQVGQDAMSIALKTDYDKLGFNAAEMNAVSVGGSAAVPCYQNSETYTLPAGLDDPALAGQIQPRVLLIKASNSALQPCVSKIVDVQDWKRTATGRDYHVTTNITAETWSTPGSSAIETGIAGFDPVDSIITSKRITVETRWLVGDGSGNCPDPEDPTGKPIPGERCVYQSFVRSPSANEQVPIGMGVSDNSADACNINSAIYCRVYVTEGNVLASNPGPTGQYPLAQPVQIFLETREPVSPNDVTVEIDYPEVDRGKACGQRTDGTAIEYGFCGDGNRIPAKRVLIGPQTATNPEGWRLVSNDAEGVGTMLMAVLIPDAAATGETTNVTLKGNVRPGQWKALFTVDGEELIRSFRWTYQDATPLVAKLDACPVDSGNGSIKFTVDGLSPNSIVYGQSRYNEDGQGLAKYAYIGESPTEMGLPVNRAALDHMEVRGTMYDANGNGKPVSIPVNKSGAASWDALARTMSQGFQIRADTLIGKENPTTGDYVFKVSMTRAVDGITTTSILTCDNRAMPSAAPSPTDTATPSPTDTAIPAP